MVPQCSLESSLESESSFAEKGKVDKEDRSQQYTTAGMKAHQILGFRSSTEVSKLKAVVMPVYTACVQLPRTLCPAWAPHYKNQYWIQPSGEPVGSLRPYMAVESAEGAGFVQHGTMTVLGRGKGRRELIVVPPSADSWVVNVEKT